MTIELAVEAGSTQVARFRVDPARLRGVGGGLSPALEVSFDGEIPARAGGVAIGVERVSLELWLSAAKPPVPIGRGATHWWPGGSFCSPENGANRTHFDLRFDLTHEQARLLEAEAARLAPHDLELEFRGDITVGWVEWVANTIRGAQGLEPQPEIPPELQRFGLISRFHPFWTTKLSGSPLRLSKEQLAQNVLPGLGMDRIRLATVRLPSGSGLLPNKIVPQYDAARLDYDAGRYREAIEKCRDVRNTIERALDAQDRDGERVADRVAQRGRCSPAMKALVGDAWRGLAVLTNDAHHPSDTSLFSPTSARTCLLLTATLVEAISELLSPD